MHATAHGGGTGRIWLTRDVVRAAEKVAHASWPRGTLHTVDLLHTVPARPSAPRRRRARGAEKNGVRGKGRTVKSGARGQLASGLSTLVAPGEAEPTDWQRRVMEANSLNASVSEQQQPATLDVPPGKALEDSAIIPSSADVETVETAKNGDDEDD
jgi:hypothetical protein